MRFAAEDANVSPGVAGPGLRQLWAWPVAILISLPVGGYVADLAVDGVDSVGAALVGGLIAGAVIGAAEWFALTGLPFVFAMWAVRGGVSVPDGVRPFLESRRIGMANVPAIAVQASVGLKLPPESIESYLKTNIHFYLGSEERRGLGLFFRQAQQLGLTPGWRPIRFREPFDWERVPAPAAQARRAIE